MNARALPPSLSENPRLDAWVEFAADGTLVLRTGKVELGQGILTALVQIAAEELDVAPDRIRPQPADTRSAPNEGFTAGSRSVESSGQAIRLVCAEIRQLLLERAAAHLQCDRSALSVDDGRILVLGLETGETYWTLRSGIDFCRKATGLAAPKSVADHRTVGTSLPRVDLPAKLRGGGFIHDLAPAGILHARCVRQPRIGARLVRVDYGALQRISGLGVRVVRIGDFLAACSDEEWRAVRAAEVLSRNCEWDGGVAIPAEAATPRFLSTQKSDDTTTARQDGEAGDPAAIVRRIEASYSRPYLAHGSIAPSCALAVFERGRMTVWTHSQGVFELRTALSRALRLAPEDITVLHVQGAGCYGHNGADDAALDAALLAREVSPRPVRVQWSREDEFCASPCGAAGLIRIAAGIDERGHPAEWSVDIWSGPHSRRPGQNGAIDLLGARALPGLEADPPPKDLPESVGGGATRNAVPPYRIGHQSVTLHLLVDLPVRTSSLRSLGAYLNVFAAESFIDELAEFASEDPAAYRLSLLADARARRVVETAVAMSGWRNRGAAGSGRGLGMGYARYKNRAGYCAVVAQVEVQESVRIERIWCAVDAGLVINPDGAINQIEGGILQSASWTLKEAIRLEDGRISSATWETYPILRFSEVPPVEVRLLPARGEPPLGVGEVSQGPTAGALGNAVAHALGIRVRDLPLDRDRILAVLLAA